MSPKKPMFGYGGEERPQPNRQAIRRDEGGHERWADAIMPADADAGAIETSTDRRPLHILAGVVVVVALILSLKLFTLQILAGQHNLGLADGNRVRQKVSYAPRGIIYDRNKEPLAENIASFDLSVVPSLLPRQAGAREKLYGDVSVLIGVSVGEIKAKTEGDCISKAQAAKVSSQVATTQCLARTQPQLVATKVPRDNALAYDQASPNIPGFSLDVNSIRQYADAGSLAAILGYTGRVSPRDLNNIKTYLPTDQIGKIGLERQYESVLRGRNGSEQSEVDATGRPVKLLGARPAIPGNSLELSIDNGLQKSLGDAIKTQLSASGSSRGAGVAMNPKTGEILAAVNLPTYDNNLFAQGISGAEYARLSADKAQPLFNTVTSGGYPTGSIIKPLVAAAALQERTISTSTTVNDTGALQIPNRYDPKITYTFRSYERGGLGPVNVARAIAVSSNVFFYTVGGGHGGVSGLGVDRLVNYYRAFGLGRKPGVDIPEQTAGRVPTPEYKKKSNGESWYLGDTFNMSVGQGDLLASPLQMAVAVSAIANGGNVMKPHFVRNVLDGNKQVVQAVKPQIVSKGVVAPEHLQTVRQAMRQVVAASYGTACCKIEEEVPVPVAAKTGTAETVVTDTGGANQSRPHSWFEAFAPYDNPQIVVVVLIERSGEGAEFAAPAVRETLKYCFTRPGGCVQ